MFRPARMRRRRSGVAFAIAIACIAAPGAAQAAPIDLGTAQSFVVLAGSVVANTGPSVLNGDLGVSPGNSLTGFGLPAIVNGATHAGDSLAANAQLDVTTAYNVAAGQPVAPADDLTGIDLGGLVLTPGAYRFTSSAQLTGPVVLDAQGDPNASFVFEIGTSLTTASASSVLLTNGASPCNVYWQVGSSATLGSATAFQGNLMALIDITVNSGAGVIGRVLARTGQVSLDNNVLSASLCTTPTTTPTPTPTPTPMSGDGGTAAAALAARTAADAAARAAARAALDAQANRISNRRPTTTRKGTTTMRRTPFATCTSGFRASVRGTLIRNVVFRLDGNRVSSLRGPYRVFVRALPGAHTVTARVTFKDATRPRTLSLGYRACADAVLRPKTGPAAFTG